MWLLHAYCLVVNLHDPSSCSIPRNAIIRHISICAFSCDSRFYHPWKRYEPVTSRNILRIQGTNDYAILHRSQVYRSHMQQALWFKEKEAASFIIFGLASKSLYSSLINKWADLPFRSGKSNSWMILRLYSMNPANGLWKLRRKKKEKIHKEHKSYTFLGIPVSEDGSEDRSSRCGIDSDRIPVMNFDALVASSSVIVRRKQQRHYRTRIPQHNTVL